jgi:16S rRNA (guanine966-N2)-methyltransferase
MRIISGSLKGRRLKAPAWDGLRPTSDRLRETLFNIVAARVPGARVLDGYAGTGAVGIEARSRGAADVVFVERDARAAALITENLAHCGVSEGCAIIRADIGRIQRILDTRRFDLVLLDPPYAEPDLEAAVARAAAWLEVGGLLVLEHARRRSAPLAAADLIRTRLVQSGDSALSFYERKAPAEETAGGEGTAS